MSVGDGVIWNENVPDNSTLAHQIDDYDRDLRIGVRSRMNREHVWPDSQTGTSEGGHHRYITLQQQTSAPVLSTGMVGAIYIGSSAAGYPLIFENSAGTATSFIVPVTSTNVDHYNYVDSTAGVKFGPLHIHSTTADPAAPITGEVWYRSDI